MDYDVVIVGAGPAGLTAGIYCVRRGLKAVVVERAALGGQMMAASEIANWPGDKTVSGSELSRRMGEHAKSLGVAFLYDEVIGFDASAREKTVMLRQKTLTCAAVILATGGQHKKLKLKGEEEYAGRGVSYCATCDAPFFKGKKVAVAGSGNMAVEDALYLSEVCAKTHLIAKTLTAEQPLMERLKKSKVETVSDSLASISGADFVGSVTLSSGKILDVEGVFISAGHTASSELASMAGVELDGRGFIKVSRSMETSLPGVYAAGDVTGGIPQITTAVGEGCTAALKAYGYVKNAG
jgi:thioredoxin reductase (NADPH)